MMEGRARSGTSVTDGAENLGQQLTDAAKAAQSVAAWRNQLKHLSESATNTYGSNAPSALRATIKAMQALRPELQRGLKESDFDFYDSQLAFVGTLTASACADRFLMDAGYSMCEQVHSLLLSKRIRSRIAGMEPRGGSGAWTELLSVTADLKWKGDERYVSRFMNVGEVWLTYQQVQQRLLMNMHADKSVSQEVMSDRLFSLSWCGLLALKMLARWMPAQLEAAIKDYRQTFGVPLTTNPRDFESGQPRGLKDPRYWDFEMFKLFFTPDVDENDLLYCYQWRLDALRAGCRDDSQFEAFKFSTRMELEKLANLFI